MNHGYVGLSPDAFPKVQIFKRTMMTAATRGALKTTQFDMWKHDENKVRQ